MVPQPSNPTTQIHDGRPAAAVAPQVRTSSNTKESAVNMQPIGSPPLVKHSDKQPVAGNGGKGNSNIGNGAVGKGNFGKGSGGKGNLVGASSSGKGASKGAWGTGSTPSSTQQAGSIKQLTDMGFTEEAAKAALTSCVWDVNEALDALLSSGAVMCPEKAADLPKNVLDHLDPEPRGGITRGKAVKKAEQGRDAENSTTASDASSPRSTQADAFCANSPSGSIADSSENSMPRQVGQTVNFQPEVRVSDSCPPSANRKNIDKDLEKHRTLVSQAQEAQMGSSTLPDATADHVENDAKGSNIATDVDESKPVVFDAKVTEEIGKTAYMVSSAPIPSRQLAQVTQAWHGDDSNTGLMMLSVHEKELLHLWSGSETESGWVYAEQPGEMNRAGWVPSSVIMKLGDGYQIMHVEQPCDAVHQTQLGIQRGMTLLVNVTSLSEGGWVYVELAKIGAKGDTATSDKEGWVPMICLK